MKFKHLALFFVGALLVACSGKPEKQEPVTDPQPSEQPVEDKPTDDLPAVVAPSQNDEQRTEWQNPDLVLERLGDLENKVVADLGAGSGYFAFKLAQKAEKVIALDIDPRALEYITEQKEIVGDWSSNIETRLTPADVPNLLDGEADVILVVNTYSFIPEREAYLPRVIKGMKAGGRLAIVDFKTGSIPVGPSDDLKLSPGQVVRELRKAGFKRIDRDETSLQYQYIIIAEK